MTVVRVEARKPPAGAMTLVELAAWWDGEYERMSAEFSAEVREVFADLDGDDLQALLDATEENSSFSPNL